jgi:leader peptidase (prepilin peptidase)/N-methyltransferase
MTSLPPAFWIASAAAFGAVVGSFNNVCIYRLPRRCLSIVRPRSSFCPACRAPIAWHDNIPVLSFLLLGGRCRRCRAPIAWRYPAVELLTAALFALAAHAEMSRVDGTPNGPSWNMIAIHCALLAALVVITFIDFDFRIIPDEITLPGTVLGVIASAAVPALQRVPVDLAAVGIHGGLWLNALATAILGALWGWGLLNGVRILGELVFRKEAMGMGDVKLMAMLGAFLGPHTVTLVFFLGCCLGSIWGGLQFIMTRDRYVAFGPFLAMAAGILILAGDPILLGVGRYFSPLTGGKAWPW